VKEVEHRGGKVRYIEVTREDIAVADRLASQVLARGLDELAPQTRRLLGLIDTLITEKARREGLDRSDARFTQRELREYANWSATQVKVQLKRLSELEYVVTHHRGGHRQRAHYELCVSTPVGAPSPFEARSHEYDSNRSGFVANRSGEKTNRSATGPAENGPVLSSHSGGMSKPVRSIGGYVSGAAENGASYPSAASYSPSAPDAAE